MVNINSQEYTKIGKDVIESLTQGMYKDCRCIYREYIQNSVDQIDKAIELGILKSKNDGVIHVKIDKQLKNIEIEDNATGIELDKVMMILRNIADSPKDRSKDRGFRGIGRLAGLAYCEKLIFETSFINESKKSIMTWDAKGLKKIINDRNTHEEASNVIDSITELIIENEDPKKHYFKVILQNVVNEILLDRVDICKYLSMVAPVPFNLSNFRLSNNIYKYVEKNDHNLDEYNIYINSDQIKKAYTTYLYEGGDNNKSKYDEILGIDFFEINHSDRLYAWGWFGISSFNGFIPSINLSRGLRLRKGNIQIGLENCLEDYHKEKRGNTYFIGEIHAVDPHLIPNSQRDFFIENEDLKIFLNSIEELFHKKLYKYYHLASNIRSHLKNIKKTLELKNEIEEKEKKGYKNKDEKNKLEEKFYDLKSNAVNSKNKLVNLASNFSIDSNTEKRILNSVVNKETEDMIDHFGDKNKEIIKIIDAIPNLIPNSTSNPNSLLEVEKLELNGCNNKKPILLIDNLKKLNKEQKKLLHKIFIIIEDVLPKELAKSLTDKISEKLK